VEWHMIGHLQRNKVKAALDLFDLIESLDNTALAKELDKEGKKRGRQVSAFVEVNLAGEESKTGIDKNQLVPLLEEVGKLSHLSVEGLMAVPPLRENPEDARPYFRALRELQSELSRLKIPNVELNELSMGMTHDYPVAIEEGATIVRVGTAIFGPREG
ncbi:MAG: YggS family pyridoxal phosphate-dependent enzyme, partial [Deltaproteobacteria bacterium]|nr:YggS family pyridoxal phosphate-dependent enzyme [Deltaproteobacteria bacterium]